ncbi:hypothetical protein [Azotosporobacter soli]|uniref:hypothetical protein n=1 Tax=Azotosporobacter soli TaxID=3055040 RepID=UPI0031FEA66F
MKIKHPDWLQIAGEAGPLYGYNQEWYKTSYQQTRGCGPTTASMLLSYLNRREAEALPYRDHDIPAITETMEQVWRFVTPGRLLGLHSTKAFCRGMNRLLREHELTWNCRRLSVAAASFRRPSIEKVTAFLTDAFTADCPVAFLNLHKGKATAMDSWHWTVLVGLELKRDEWRATCYDSGRAITFDLALWLETTRLGGGFAYVKV